MTYTPSIGDVIVKEKVFGIFNHVGVVIAPNLVLQNTPRHGEHISYMDDFAEGQPVKIQSTGANPLHVMARAGRILAKAKAYNLFSRNCEHTVSDVTHGRPKSPQLLFFLTIALILGLIILLSARR